MDSYDLNSHTMAMPQLSSPDRLLMAASNMSNALQHPHLEVHFHRVRADTISALTALADIF
jgi:hypothetical protein